MIEKHNFKDLVNEALKNSKSSSNGVLRELSKSSHFYSRLTCLGALLSLCMLSGCSTIQQKVSAVADAFKTDAQTAHDGNFRIRRVRKCLASTDIAGAESHRDTIQSMHWRCIANIEIASAKHPLCLEEALKLIEATTEEIWKISDAGSRAMVLLALLTFELETHVDIPKAQATIKKTEQTIAFILDNHALKMRRFGELQDILEKHNHILSR